MRFVFDWDKALASILYISGKLREKRQGHKPDYYKVLKIIYFAEVEHLKKYGVPIIGDFYVAMKHGPVPSKAYDMIKAAKGDSPFSDPKGLSTYFTVHGINITPLKEPDMDQFSTSNLECLDKAIEENRGLSFDELHKKSDTNAYKKARRDDEIAISEIVEDWGADPTMIECLKDHAENQTFLAGFNKN